MVIPPSVWSCSELNDSEKMLYGHISTLVTQLGYVSVNDSYLSKISNIGIQILPRYLDNLLRLGFISYEVTNGKSSEEDERKIIINMNPVSQPATRVTPPVTPVTRVTQPVVPVTQTMARVTQSMLRVNQPVVPVTNQAEMKSAFDHFWAGMKLTRRNEMDSYSAFVYAYNTSDSVNPIDFANGLISDHEKRVDVGQYGFCNISPVNYLKKRLWTDEIKSPQDYNKKKNTVDFSKKSDGRVLNKMAKFNKYFD